MHIDLATVTLVGALQTALMAIALGLVTRNYTGAAGASLRLRAWSLALEAGGWLLFAFRGRIGDLWSIAAGMALIMVAYALTVRALRQLLGTRQYRWLLPIIGTAAWLGVLWFAFVRPDEQWRVLLAAGYCSICLSLSCAALLPSWRREGSLAGRLLSTVLTLSLGLLLWRVADVALAGSSWFGLPSRAGGVLDPAGGLLDPMASALIYVFLAAIRPLFTSVGFLLLYNETMQADLRCLARIDPLTGVNNRLALTEWAEILFARARRGGGSFAALMLDADHFKAINDRFGHAGGDRVLLSLVDSIHACLRVDDVIGRVGGEEFVLLVPGNDLLGAMALGERVRALVAATELDLDGERLALTVSIGVTVSRPGENRVDRLLARADAALYAAKHAGRNCVMSDEVLAGVGAAALATPERRRLDRLPSTSQA